MTYAGSAGLPRVTMGERFQRLRTLSACSSRARTRRPETCNGRYSTEEPSIWREWQVGHP